MSTDSIPQVEKEEAFAEVIRAYENKWVALIEKDGREVVVGSGSTPRQALVEAKTKGFSTVTLFSVPSFSKVFIY